MRMQVIDQKQRSPIVPPVPFMCEPTTVSPLRLTRSPAPSGRGDTGGSAEAKRHCSNLSADLT
jgi:hypothetical protein